MKNNMHEIYHSDHLGSSTYLTDNFGRPSHYYETLPFGEMIVEHNQSTYYKSPYPTTNTGDYDNAYKFNGKELDDATQMYYFSARYMDPRLSIFVSVDPLAEKYYDISPYAYVANNPINAIDPDGRQIIPVHGTWSNPNTWQDLKGITSASSKLFGDDNLGGSFQWSGANYSVYRTKAAYELISHIRKEREGLDPCEPITLVGHSHGGNVSIEAINIMTNMEEFSGVEINLITINTPVRDDYQLSDDASKRVNHVNIYDTRDPVQIGGGNSLQVLPYQPSDAKGTGEFGPAGRKFDNATNIKVDNPQGIFSDFHNSHNRTKDWINKIEVE